MSGYIGINRGLQPGGVCTECHIPTTEGGAASLTPVNLPYRFIYGAYFNHGANGHKDAECSECHVADSSDSATDLLLPDVESCTTCHKGETAQATEKIVPSGCALCHGYHAPDVRSLPRDHPDTPGNEDNTTVAAILSSLRR